MNNIWKDETSTVEATRIHTEHDTVWLNFLIKTGNFTGRHTFFVLPSEIEKYIDTLVCMYNDLDGCLIIRDRESDAKIQLSKIDDGWCLCGQLGSSWDHNMLVFHVSVDQTVIKIMMDFLKDSTQ